jgi:LacI family transcriptional regulator
MIPANSASSVENCRLLKKQKMPFVLFDRYFQENEVDCSYVATDSFTASEQLVDYLVKCGHRNIAHIGGSLKNSFARLMFEGYKSGLKKNGLKFNEELVYRGYLNETTGVSGIQHFLDEGLKFTAVHTANDPIAIGVLDICQKLGIAIPEQLSVTGFSDITVAKNVYAPLTTVKEPTFEIGRIAADGLVEQIENADKTIPVKELLIGEFIPRKSCSKI